MKIITILYKVLNLLLTKGSTKNYYIKTKNTKKRQSFDWRLVAKMEFLKTLL
jgi:hypothetical protein